MSIEAMKQEPVAWIKNDELAFMSAAAMLGQTEWKTNLGLKPEAGDVPLYTAPVHASDMSQERVDETEKDRHEPVAHLWECLGRWSAYLASHGGEAELAPPQWLCDAINAATAPPKREWVGLTKEDGEMLVAKARKVPTEIPCPDYNERLLALVDNFLKEKNG
jgi:hypothetical protein